MGGTSLRLPFRRHKPREHPPKHPPSTFAHHANAHAELTILKESADAFSPLKSAVGGIPFTLEVCEERGVYDLSKALARISLPPKDLHSLWRSQIEFFELSHPDASHIFHQVNIPQEITNPKRIKDYIRSTSITPGGKAFAPQCSEVLPGRLWVADHFSGTDLPTLQSLGITHVVCIGHDEYHLACPRLPTVFHLPVTVTYNVSLVGVIDDTVVIIDDLLKSDPTNRLLIHCTMGMDWSPSIAVACIMNSTGCCFQSAREFVCRARETVRLDPSLEEAVQQWWTLEQLRHVFPVGRGHREFKWAVEETEIDEEQNSE